MVHFLVPLPIPTDSSWVLQETNTEILRFVCRGFLDSVFQNTCKEGEREVELGRKQKWKCDIITNMASADPFRSSETEMIFRGYLNPGKGV